MANVSQKAMSTYFAIVHKDPGSAYGVVFPDVPGCFGAGDTYDEAVASAGEALRLHAEGLAAGSRNLPQPRSFEQLLGDPELSEEARGAAIVPIEYHNEIDDHVAIVVDVESALLDALDLAARKRGISRSAFLTEALREKVAD